MVAPDNYNMGILGEIFESTKALIAIALLLSGVGLLILGILAASTGLFTWLFGLSVYGSWRLAGVFGGLGLPLVIVGVFTVLPATKTQRIGAAAGLGLVMLGVLLFAFNFPNNWYGRETDRTFLVVSVYFLGSMLTLLYLFLAVANLQTPSSRTTRGNQRHTQYSTRNQNPQTAAALVQGIIGMILQSIDDTEEQSTDELDLDTVATMLADELDHRVEDITEQDGHLVAVRAEGTTHAEFTTKLPRYAEVVDRNGTQYALNIDAVSFRLA